MTPAADPAGSLQASAARETSRMPAAERRAMILDSARDLFGRRGYNGTTTDQIAQAAGISQPYVVRMFGTKEKLFLEVLAGALATLLDAFRGALAETTARGGSHDEVQEVLGAAYIDLVTTRGLHTVLMQAFVSGSDVEIGTQAREGFLDIYRMLRDEARFTADEVHSFLGTGMLFSVLLGVELPRIARTDGDAAELMEVAFGSKSGDVLDAMQPQASV